MALHPKYVLFYSVRSPFARRVRVAFSRLGLSFETREISVFEPTAEFLSANPLGTVPALLVRGPSADPKDAVALGDSDAILEYLHENYGGKIWSSDLAVRARVRAASVLAVGLMTETVRWFLENQRPSPSAEWNAEYLENIDRTLAAINAQPWKSLPWKVSDFQLTQAGYDLAIALDYMQLRLRGFDWQTKYPELARFQEIHRSRQDLASSLPPT